MKGTTWKKVEKGSIAYKDNVSDAYRPKENRKTKSTLESSWKGCEKVRNNKLVVNSYREKWRQLLRVAKL
jgi:hypothetical protein